MGKRRLSGTTSRRQLLVAGASLALGAALGGPVAGRAAPLACDTPPREPTPFGEPDLLASGSTLSGPLPTTVRSDGGRYVYQVDGLPTRVRGMGYNPSVTALTSEARRTRLLRDFGLMANAGVNTVVGWNPAVLDGMALDVAAETGVGVALPFDVDFTLDVADPAVQRRLASTILSWVDRYRQHPALRLWAVGNEVLQRSVPPAWCGTPPSDRQASWASAWASLLIQLADAIHARDPYHPVLYREAEDAYTSWLARALADDPDDRPWLVYGVNAYTPRLAAILDGWSGSGVPTSLLVSEFAPLNGQRGERAASYREIWSVIRARSSFVLGGSVYVWSTDGPEMVDRSFGLVDASGEAVDDALDTISELYHEDAGDAERVSARQIGASSDDASMARQNEASASSADTRAGGSLAQRRSGDGPVLS
ncbi:MAG: hypothetical protein U0893_05555 [Chloroflexota bacterium]